MQFPVCAGTGSGMLYLKDSMNGQVWMYDRALPWSYSIAPYNPIAVAGGLNVLENTVAVSDNLNAPGPSPTYYTTLSGSYVYRSATAWVNTGHSIGTTSSHMGIGAGGGFIYCLDADDGKVYKYNGTANASLLVTLPASTHYVADIAADCNGNFYVLDLAGSNAGLHKYSSSSSYVSSWSISGIGNDTIGNGLGMVDNHVYYGYTAGPSNPSLRYIKDGLISGSSISYTVLVSGGVGGLVTFDFATCPWGNYIAVAGADTSYYCGIPDTLIGYGTGSLTWSVLSGPATLSGSGDTVTVTSTANAKLLLTSSSTPICGGNTDTVQLLYIPQPNASGTNALCTGDSIHLYATDTAYGIAWHWSGPNSFIDSVANTHRAAITLADSGDYIVCAISPGCTAKDTVHISINPMPATPTVTSNSPICAGDTLQFTINNVQSSVSYTWFGPASFTSSNPNPYRLNAQTNYSGTYKVVANLNGCKDSSTTSATLNAAIGPPTISITANPNDTICLGDNATFTATTGNATSPIYQWKHNGANAGTNSISFMPSSVSNSDIIKCHVASNSQCQAIDTALSSGITMHVLSLAPPTLSITYTHSGSFYVFTAHTNPSINLTYQWYKNGNPMAGATGLTYSTSNLTTGDSLCLHVHSAVMCTQPDSVVECTQISSSIFNLQSSISNINVWPNPATSVLYIEACEKVNVVISSIEGKTLMQKQDAKSIDISDLSGGMYLISIYAEKGLLRKVEKLLKE